MAADEASRYRYAALVFSPPKGPNGRHVMHGGKETFEGRILSLVPEGEQTRWRDWLGYVAWEKIRRTERIVIARAASDGPTVLGAEDHRLRNEMHSAWTAFLLASRDHASDPAWILSGEVEGDTLGSRPKTLTTAQQTEHIVSPAYRHRARYVELEWGRLWEKTRGIPDESWFPLWVEADALLARTPRPLILGYALMSFASSRSRLFLEFSIPECVRAAEGIIAIPREAKARNRLSMQDTFCERARRLVPSLATDEYVRADLDAVLPKLYQLRSDCFHGKVPFEDMQARGEAGQDEAAQLAYVGDVLAREALLVALRRPDWSVFESRAILEAAWASGAFP